MHTVVATRVGGSMTLLQPSPRLRQVPPSVSAPSRKSTSSSLGARPVVMQAAVRGPSQQPVMVAMAPQQRRFRAATEEDLEVAEMAISGSYNAAVNTSVWERRPVPVIARCITIAVEFLQWHLSHPDDPAPPQPGGPSQAAAKPGGAGAGAGADAAARWSAPELRSPRKVQRAAAMRELLVRLGPAFVKIGQALSSRPDILPPSYLVELEALQDRIPAFDNVLAFQVLEQELGTPVRALFQDMSPEPVAAASLGQVYRAVLQGGRVVAVKVQRPGVAEAIALDVFILRWLAALLRRVYKFNTDLPTLVDEWATSLFRELDYRTEASNARRFRELYSSLEGVYVPETLPELTTSKVLTMEWVEGERLRSVADNIADDDRRQLLLTGGAPGTSGRGGRVAAPPSSSSSAGSDRDGSDMDLALVQVGVNCSLEQMLEVGFYHADPHLGNLMRTRDGKLAYLDFGMCGELDKKTRDALIRATLHLVNREYQPLAQDFIDLGLLPPGSDKAKIVPALTGVFQQALSRGVSNLSFGDLSEQLAQTMFEYGFRVPSYYTLLVRSLTMLEGIALASNPNYMVLGSAYPWIARRLLTNQTPELQSALRTLLYTPGGSFRFWRLESLLQEAVRAPRGLPPAMAAAQSRIVNGGGAIPTSKPGSNPGGTAAAAASTGGSKGASALALLLSPDATFVRDILLDELAKGVDAGWRVAWDQCVHSAQRPLATLNSVPVLGPWLMPLLMPLTSPAPDTATRPDSQAGSSGAGSTASSLPQWGSAGSSPAGASLALPWPFADAFPPLTPEELERRQVAGPAGQLLAALPQLSSQQDRHQVEGLRRLAQAMADLAATSSGVGGAGVADVGQVLPALGSLETQAATQLRQAAEGLRWLVRELAALPQAQQQKLAKLPVELASRVASRLTARTVRLVLAGGQDPEGEQRAKERESGKDK